MALTYHWGRADQGSHISGLWNFDTLSETLRVPAGCPRVLPDRKQEPPKVVTEIIALLACAFFGLGLIVEALRQAQTGDSEVLTIATSTLAVAVVIWRLIKLDDLRLRRAGSLKQGPEETPDWKRAQQLMDRLAKIEDKLDEQRGAAASANAGHAGQFASSDAPTDPTKGLVAEKEKLQRELTKIVRRL